MIGRSVLCVCILICAQTTLSEVCVQTSGDKGAGIGVLLTPADLYFRIERIETNSAAQDFPLILHPGAYVVGVQTGGAASAVIDVKGWSLSAVLDLIRGDSGTEVALLVSDDVASTSRTSVIVRLVRRRLPPDLINPPYGILPPLSQPKNDEGSGESNRGDKGVTGE